MHKMKSVAVFVYILGASLALEPEYRNSGEEIVPEVVGDGPVEQEDQQDENQNGFGKLLIKKQALPTLSQFLRGMPQQQSFFVPEASQYDQRLFRFQPAYQLNPAAFGPNQYTQSFQAAKIYQHPMITGVESQAPAAIMLDQYTPSYQTDSLSDML
ncbi:uncharacterized protein LOC136040915 isoform X1 [Artemia franciscana]|uniref:uncharacterized protein LOC136040915 isoform X1 n=1 Tax=Artemia franciscana TaxID=6661 RepID=UPI0032DB0234